MARFCVGHVGQLTPLLPYTALLMPYMCPTRKITKTIDIELLNHLLPYMPYSFELQDLHLCNQSNIQINPPLRSGVRHS